MLLCRVLCGKSCVGNKKIELTKWPEMKNGNGQIYDSLVDNVYDPSIYVIHDDARAYPNFVVYFRLESINL